MNPGQQSSVMRLIIRDVASFLTNLADKIDTYETTGAWAAQALASDAKKAPTKRAKNKDAKKKAPTAHNLFVSEVSPIPS